LQNSAILNREEAFVARTFKPVFCLRIIDRARKMSAFLAVAYIFVFGGADQDAMVLFCWLAEKFHSPNRNLSTSSHWLLRVDGGLVENRANQNPHVAHEHTEAGQD
jgi:hypothetical protein